LAYDEQRTVAEARRLFAAVDRPNVMIKVPATPQGIPAIRTLIGLGININITLMFSLAHYEAVAWAYIEGLQHLYDSGGALENVASVASFFVSRVDSAVDRRLSAIDGPAASALVGKAAIANSRVVYDRFDEIFDGEPFDALAAKGARVQRLLWASTSTKNPAYPDTLYVDELIGPHTVNTMPPQTVDAFRDHGRVAATLESGLDEAKAVLAELAALGVNMTEVTEQLQVEGVHSFASSFDALLSSLAERRAQMVAAAA
jgi:transaldolase